MNDFQQQPTLPSMPDSVLPESVRSDQPVLPARLRVLIVEDEFVIANDLRFIVETVGYEVIGIAKSATKARQLLADALVRPDIVLLDIHLQDGETGIALGKELGEQHQLPFIYVTSHSDSQTLEAARSTIPDGYIVKPFQEKDIHAALDMAYYRHAHSREADLRQQKETLLRVANAVATVQDKRDLLRVILAEVKSIFDCYDFGIATFLPGRETLMDWTVAYPAIDPSAANQAAHTADLSIWTYRGSPLEWGVGEVERTGEPLLFTFDPASLARWPDNPMLQLEQEHGYEELLFTTLKVRGQLLGTFNINSVQKGQFATVDKLLFQGIADQVAVAVANILANEEILEREREKTLLLSISEAIATVRSKEDILGLIVQKVKPLFKFYDCGILIVDKTNRYHDLAVIHPTIDESDVNYSLKGQGFYQNEGLAFRGSGIEWLINQIEAAKSPLVFDYMADSSSFSDHLLLEELRNLGYKQAVAGTLKTGGEIFGCFTINYTEQGQAQQVQIPLFQNVVDQLSSAVANILANEEIREREQEKSVLLAISEQLATIRDESGLFKIIYEKLKPIFGFDNTVIALYDKDLTYTQHIHTAIEYQDNLYYQQIMAEKFPTHQSPHGEFIHYEGPRIVSLTYFLTHYPDHVGVKVMETMGLQECVIIPLHFGDRMLATFEMHSLERGRFSESKIPLYHNLGNQLAVAVANMLANDEIRAREREKTLLLSISEAIASARNAVELLTVIRQKAQQLIPFYDTGILIVDPDGQHHYDLAVNMSGWDESDGNRQLQAAGLHRIPHPESYVAHVMDLIDEARGPVIEDYQLRYETFDYPFFSIGRQLGYKEAIVTSLKSGGNVLGTFWLNSLQKGQFKPQQFEIFQALADQVAVAVANILANEEILKREREKAKLLEITELIAQVKDTDDLLTLIVEKIKPLFDFHDCGLFVLNADGETHTDLAATIPEVSPSQWNEKIAAVSMNMAHRGSPVEWMMRNIGKINQPVLFNFNELAEKFPDYPQFAGTELLTMGYRDCLAANLTVRGSSIGMFCINALQKDYFQPSVYPLFQAVTHSISIAVANILANEEILEREREKSQLLEISQAIAQVQNSKQLLRIIYEKVKPVFPYDNAGLYVFDQTGENYWGLLNTEVLPDEIQTQLEQANLLGPYRYKGHHPDIWGYAETAAIYSRPAQGMLFAEASKERSSNDIIVASGLKQMIGGPLYCGGRKIGLLCFNAKQADFYTAKHLSLFQAISDQIAVAVANILANEEIREREREKSLQLSLISTLTDDKTWPERLLSIGQHLQPHLPFDHLYIALEQTADVRFEQALFRIGPDDYQVIDPEAMQRMTRLSAEKINQWRLDQRRSAPGLLNDEAYSIFCRRHPTAGVVATAFSLQSALLLCLPLSHQNCLLIVLSHKNPAAYQPRHWEQFREVIGGLQPTIERLLAYDEINRLKEQVEGEKDYLAEEIKQTHNFGEIVGNSEPLQHVFRRISLVALTDTTVLLEGETGTGKELFARAIHDASPRSGRVLVKVNCAALPANLIESELFGHEKGAFTGAIDRRVGKFELASGGTLFLDEIGEMPLELQPKLLRALQEKEIERVGGRQTIRCDVRIITATNRNLEQEVAAGRFRQDLFYRLNVFVIALPALRQRPGDVGLLATHFLHRFAKRFGRTVRGFSADALKELQAHDWPGNIRELEHIIEQSMILSEGPVVELAKSLQRTNRADPTLDEPIIKSWQQAERDNIIAALTFVGGRVRGKGGAAELLGIHPNTLDSRMKMLGIHREFS